MYLHRSDILIWFIDSRDVYWHRQLDLHTTKITLPQLKKTYRQYMVGKIYLDILKIFSLQLTIPGND